MKGRGDKCVLDTELSLTYSQSYFCLIFQSIVRPLWQSSGLKSWNHLDSEEGISLHFSSPHHLLQHADHIWKIVGSVSSFPLGFQSTSFSPSFQEIILCFHESLICCSFYSGHLFSLNFYLPIFIHCLIF